MGWVSMFCPQQLAQLLNMPDDSQPVAILCLGPVHAFYPRPMLVAENWASRAELADMVFDNTWGQPGMPTVDTGSALQAQTHTKDSA